MGHKTEKTFLKDAYLATCEARVIAVNERGGIILDHTVFYATSGGQPGDTGFLERSDGTKIRIAATVYGEDREEIVHVADEGQPLPEVGETIICHLDWDRRHRLMQMHSACHVLSVVCPYPITSASVGDKESRVDFDIPEAGFTKEAVTEEIMAIINANHPIYDGWISEADLDANPDLVKSKNVKPPRGAGQIRLVYIGEEGTIDSQPCGGTHVSETGEIGPIHIGKIEKKGKENRRFRIRFGEAPAG